MVMVRAGTKYAVRVCGSQIVGQKVYANIVKVRRIRYNVRRTKICFRLADNNNISDYECTLGLAYILNTAYSLRDVHRTYITPRGVRSVIVYVGVPRTI